MPPRLRLFYSLLAAGFLLLPGLELYNELSRRPDIWWTPPPMALSLSDSKDRVEIYVRGEPFGALVQAGQLSLQDAGRSSALTTQDIRLRFNNWDRVRAARLPWVVFYAASLGALLVLLLVIASGRLAYRGETQPSP